MTQLLNGLDQNTQLAQVEVFDPVTGHIDAVATREATKIILHDQNTVRLPNGTVDFVATLAKRKTAKATFLASRQ